MGLFKSDPPDPPDYGPLAAASERQAELSHALAREQFEWAKQAYEKDSEITEQVSTLFLKSMNDAQDQAEADRARYEEIYQPLEDSLAAEASDYASPERRAAEMGKAGAEVGQQFDAARDSAQRQLESFGVNPSATRFAALDLGFRMDEAAAKAAASTMAGERVDATGRALRSEAINVGRGYPAQIQGSYGTSTGAGTEAVNTALSGTKTGAQTMGTGVQWQGAGNQALDIWGNILGQDYQNQLGFWEAENAGSAGVGKALGLAGGMAAKYFMGMDKGGAVPAEASPSRGVRPDDVKAAVSVGEFVIPRETVEWLGQKHFHGLVEKSNKERQESGAVPIRTPLPVATRQAIQMGAR